MKYLVTGGCGFLGSNLASHLLKLGENVVVLDNLYRFGSANNLEWLYKQGNFKFYNLDVRNPVDVETAISSEEPDVVFHLAGQVAMTTSIENPRFDFDVNALGTLNILESLRKNKPNTIIVYSSTNKVYGDLEFLDYQEEESRYTIKNFPDGIDETAPLEFHSPYGCSKGCADQYVLDYSRIYGLRGVVFRHSSIYGGRQFSTFDQGWIGWFCQQAIETKRNPERDAFTIAGSGKQVRDVLHADDAVRCYLSAVANIETAKGNAFNIGGGPSNSLSLLELFQFLENKVQVKLQYHSTLARISDQKVFIANYQKANRLLKWEPQISKDYGIDDMLNWLFEISANRNKVNIH